MFPCSHSPVPENQEEEVCLTPLLQWKGIPWNANVSQDPSKLPADVHVHNYVYTLVHL